MDAPGEAHKVRDLISRCVLGDHDAVTRFQRGCGESIHGLPMQAHLIPTGQAGDFHVFAFEDGRIFRRLCTYEGRALFRAYLLGSVLDHLVLEWMRTQHDIETVSIEALGELPDGDPAGADDPADSHPSPFETTPGAFPAGGR